MFFQIFIFLQSTYHNKESCPHSVIAASNAATLLARAGISFSGRDFSGIQIPHADIGNSICDGTNFKGADMHGVNIASSWLRNSDMSGAILSDLKLGEFAYLEFDQPVTNCCFSKTKWLAVAFGNKVNLYDDALKYQYTVQKHEECVTCVDFDPKEEKCASGGKDHKIAVWNCSNPKQIGILKEHNSIVTGISFNHSGELLVSADKDKKIILWEVQENCDLKAMKHYENLDPVRTIVFHPKENKFLSGDEKGIICLWQDQKEQQPLKLHEHVSQINCIKFNHEGDKFLSCADGTQKNLIIWTYPLTTIYKILVGHTYTVNCGSFSPDNGKNIISGSEGCTMRIWNSETGACLASLKGHKDFVDGGISFSPCGKKFVSGSKDKTVRLWDYYAKNQKQHLPGHKNTVWCVSFNKDGTKFVSGSNDNELRIWNCQTSCCDVLAKHNGHIYCVVFHPDDKHVISGGRDGVVRIWDLDNKKCIPTIEETDIGGAEYHQIFSLKYIHEKEYIIAGTNDGMIKLWAINTENHPTLEKEIKEAHNGAVNALDIYQKNNTIASVGNDKKVKIWEWCSDIFDLKNIFSIETDSLMKSVAFYPTKDNILLLGSKNGSIEIFDTNKGKPQPFDKKHFGSVNNIVFCKQLDGKDLFFTAGDDGLLYIWKNDEVVSVINTGAKIYGLDNFGFFLITSHIDCSVKYWKINHDCKNLQLIWSVPQNVLVMDGANFNNTTIEDEDVRKLLQQRGACGLKENTN